MEIQKIIQSTNKPLLYEKGTAVMWTDEHISKKLLEIHINPDIDLASRTKKTIDKTVQWLMKEFDKSYGDLLDLGCGPGLYAEQFAKFSYNVTGIDFSINSITYAKESSAKKDLNINYICKNYLEIDYDNKFDLIVMIYCDFGVLSIDERQQLIKNIYRALKKNGIFIFDVLNKNVLNEHKLEHNWELSENGFWSNTPYLYLYNNFHYPENQVILDQHIVINEKDEYKVYRFWEHYFHEKNLIKEFNKLGFKNIANFENIISDKRVTFYKAIK